MCDDPYIHKFVKHQCGILALLECVRNWRYLISNNITLVVSKYNKIRHMCAKITTALTPLRVVVECWYGYFVHMSLNNWILIRLSCYHLILNTFFVKLSTTPSNFAIQSFSFIFFIYIV